MFWLGIALVIIGVYIMTKAFYDLGYNAGFTDGKKVVPSPNGIIYEHPLNWPVNWPICKIELQKSKVYVGGRLFGKHLLVYDLKMNPDYLINIETEEIIKLKP